MELDFNKLISYRNKEKAIIGKKYYFMDAITFESLKSVNTYCEMAKLSKVLDTEQFAFCYKTCESDSKHNFIYPVEEN